MRIGELSRSTGKSVAALRYYEQIALIVPLERTQAGYRDYAPDVVERVRFIVQAQERGFTLREIKAVLALLERGQVPCPGVAKAARRKIQRLEERIAQLQARRAALAEAVQLWESGSLGESRFCPLLGASKSNSGSEVNMGKVVEVFIAGCPLCDEAVKTVQAVACSNCEVKVYDLREGCATNECRELAARYGVRQVPTVVVDGQIAACCQAEGISESGLRALGVGAG